MNFNVYLNKKTGEKISLIAKNLHRSRNSIINEALDEWVSRHYQSSWPPGFFDFEPIEDVPDFKSLRNDLKNNVKEDPLA